MNFRVIGLSGRAGCGKDTAAAHLAARFGFVVCAFAAPLKAALNALFNWPASAWDNREWKERPQPGIGKSPRHLAQTLGTEWGRNLVHPDLWMLIAEQRMREAFAAGKPGIVFTDCRFVNEAELVRRMTGAVIRIERNTEYSVAAHVSETPIPDHLVSAVVENNGTLAEFYDKMRAVIELTPGLSVPSGTVDEPVARMPDETFARCGHMSRTKRVCTQPEGHRLRHNDGVALWDSHE